MSCYKFINTHIDPFLHEKKEEEYYLKDDCIDKLLISLAN